MIDNQSEEVSRVIWVEQRAARYAKRDRKKWSAWTVGPPEFLSVALRTAPDAEEESDAELLYRIAANSWASRRRLSWIAGACWSLVGIALLAFLFIVVNQTW